MNLNTTNTSKLCITLLLAALSASSAFAQKVKVGYDKSADFKRYTTYTWAEATSPPTRPMLYAAVVGSIDHELKSKGLTRTESNGDLVLIPSGGVEFGTTTAAATPILGTYAGPPPAIDATMWTGAGGSAAAASTTTSEGTLLLNFVDRSGNKIIWTGAVSLKLDMEKKNQSLERIDKAIAKLLKQYPPEKSRQ